MSVPASLLRLAILPDFAEEGWPSMDLVAEMLVYRLSNEHRHAFVAEALRPAYCRRFVRLSPNADRLMNRLVDYPRYVRRAIDRFDAFHVCDHSYAQLVNDIPTGRAGVFCHDLDTFACLLDPARDLRPKWFRAMARRILRGFQKSAIVFHATDAVRQHILRYGLIDPAKLIKAPFGAAPEFVADEDAKLSMLSATSAMGPFVLHVGSCIPRKRIDVLFETFASVRGSHPGLRLIHVGDAWTDEQRVQIERLGIDQQVVCMTRQPRSTLAALYRAAACVLITSDAEGFGLPLLEALACGVRVVASDLPALREVGGDAASYAPVGEVSAYASALNAILIGDRATTRSARLAQARKFSWSTHADTIANAYRNLLKP